MGIVCMMLLYELEKNKLILRKWEWGFSFSESHSTGRINPRQIIRKLRSPIDVYIPPPKYDSRSFHLIANGHYYRPRSLIHSNLHPGTDSTTVFRRHQPPHLPLRRSTGSLVWLVRRFGNLGVGSVVPVVVMRRSRFSVFLAADSVLLFVCFHTS